jgi:FkbM family methyltransferase
MQRLQGTTLGRITTRARNSIALLGAAYSQSEKMGMFMNDSIAGTLVTRLCQGDRTFIDVGAHIGTIISEVSYHDPSVRIIAIEAAPGKVARLRRQFPRVEFHDCALGDSDGEAAFFVNTRQSGYSSLVCPPASCRADVTETRVPLKRLDSVVSRRDVDVIKVDVEGAELGVLRGGERLIAENRPTILFESALDTVDGWKHAKEELWRWFAEREYVTLIPNRVAHDDPGMSRDGFLESHVYPIRTTNYLAVARERRIEIRDRARVILGI